MTTTLWTPKYLASKIEAATDSNNHTLAVMLLAEFLGGDYPKLMSHVKAIHDLEGSIPDGIYQYRTELRQKMMKTVLLKYGAESHELIRKAF